MNASSYIAIALVAVGLSAGLPEEANAYSFFNCPGQDTKWDDSSQTFIINRNHFDNNPRVGEVISEMQLAASRINSLAGSGFKATVTAANNGNGMIAYGNGVNDVLLDIGGTYGLNGSRAQVVLAADGDCDATSNTTSNGRFIEVDIVFSNTVTWQPDPLSGNYIGALFAHEMGHAMGIGHSDTQVLAQMNRIVGRELGGPSSGEQGIPSFHGDDASALRQIYPTSTAGANIYTSKWRRAPNSVANPNSAPVFARLLTNTGGVVGATINSGTRYRIQYTVGNNGTSRRFPTVRFHYSTDQNIAPSDPSLGSTLLNLASGQSAQGTYTFDMPPLVSGQRYWLGYSVSVSGDIDAGDNRARIRKLGNDWFTAN